MMFANRHCAPLPGGARPLAEAQIRTLLGELGLWTHALDGLSGNDFILAAKLDAVAVG